MAQHDYNIANQGFPATRADINDALAAIVSNNSGTSAPSTTFANQWWYDTTNDILYIRNEANDAWIKVATLDQTNDAVGTIHTDQILEGVSGNGVSIDGVVAKDSIIQASGQPSFSAEYRGSAILAGNDIVFGTVRHNTGSHYDNTTGVFTAPVAGKYLFTAALLTDATTASGLKYCELRVNGSIYVYAYAYVNATSQYHPAIISQVVDLSASDAVKVRTGTGAWYGTPGINAMVFSGQLLS
jgi:hypothetical protein